MQFSATIGRTPVTLNTTGQVTTSPTGHKRFIYQATNAAGRELGIVVARTGGNTGRYVDIPQDVTRTPDPTWHVALGHQPRTSPPARDEEISGLNFPPAPVALEYSDNFVAGQEVAIHIPSYDWRGCQVDGRVHMTTIAKISGGVISVASGEQFMSRRGGPLRCVDGCPSAEIFPVGHPIVVRITQPAPVAAAQFGDWGFENDLQALSGGHFG
jgi:hypothetical protein